MQEALEQISSTNASAKRIIEQARAEYSFTPFEDPVNLSPELDRTLDDILRNMPNDPLES